MSLESDRLARVVLSRIGEPGDPRLTGLVDELGAERVLKSLREQAGRSDLKDDLAQRLIDVDPDRDLDRAQGRGIRFVIPGDDEWPAGLADLGHCPRLHERGGVPVGLWARGPLRLDQAAERATAVVGSRSCTSYGADISKALGAGLAEAQQTVVSGAAFGIDQAAHRGALAMKGRTVAVLACGVDRAYPATHKELLDYIADVGLVVSEAPPGGAPTRIRFLARNRLIAAFAQGTVIVEAAVRSGALNTASWAGGLGRTVMGVPGPITSAPSEGVHQLIRHRNALLVTSAAEVLEAVAPVGDLAMAEPREEPRARDLLTPQQRQILDAVPVAQGAGATRIARTAGLAAARVQADLGVLFEAGLVEQAAGRWRLVDCRE